MKTGAERFFVVCLCAEWCTTCCEYRVGFQALVKRFPGIDFFWFDIEDHADAMGDLEVENFPTLLIARGDTILFYGTMLPHVSHLTRMLDVFCSQISGRFLEGSKAPAASGAHQRHGDLLTLLHHIAHEHRKLQAPG